MQPESFGPRLKELRIERGMTQPQLAGLAGLTKGGLADLESGRRNPTWATVLALAAALGVKCDAFQVEPASNEPQGRGRPAKPAAEPPSNKSKTRKGKK